MRNKREYMRHAVVLILATVGTIICTAPSSASYGLASAQATAPSWSFTGSLNTPRAGCTATLLPNGKVLVAGGSRQDPRAELYDPANGTWSYTGSLNANREGYSATLLQNGKVLVAAGYTVNSGSINFINTAELYDPATGAWSFTGTLNTSRAGHTATLLQNGKVLVAGGTNHEDYVTNSVELYDPATGAWSVTGTLVSGTAGTGRAGHTATLLQSGKVLVAGGQDSGDFSVFATELYDPATGTWSVSGRLNEDRSIHTATLLPNGDVLIAGACNAGIFCVSGASSAELYNPVTGTWSVTGAMNTPRFFHTATLLPDGGVLIAGGEHVNFFTGTEVFLNSAEIYDPASGNWSTTANLNGPRLFHAATLLQNGKVLVVGGRAGTNSGPLLSAELHDSGSSTINPIADPQFFVRQHYLDFLNREPDPQGLAFWTGEITFCGSDAQCVEAKRINVSAAFFLSIEFQETGYFVHRLHKVAYGNIPGTPVPVRREEFLTDAQQIGFGVQVGVGNWEQQIDANKNTYASTFVSRARFTNAYLAGTDSGAFVDQLNANAGGALSQEERDNLVNALAGGSMSRAQALRAVAEDADLLRAEFNRAFVLMQYFGYLRRDPDAVGFDGQPDPNFLGFNFWLAKLDQFRGDFIQAEMVKAFISSTEYRLRFGPP